jgi:serine-type D-Ala-D-Ala carboxypeptidase/endopeptidase (penicillin-binding protein 4)
MRWLPWFSMCAVLSVAHGGELPAGVQRVLSGHAIEPEAVSIYVQDVDANEPALSHNADVPRNPASVMKLVTTWTALELLGPTYTWPTEIYFDGDFDGTVLQGDLGIKGYGDPFLVVEEFWKMLRFLRNFGLEEINGDLVLDDSYFAIVEDPPGAFDDEPYRTYNVVPNALLANFKAVQFQFFADTLENKVRIATDPVLRNLDIRNRIRLVDGPCRGFQAGIAFHVDDPQTLARVTFDGDFPRRCNSYSLARTVLQHDTYVYSLFTSLWGELGGRFSGGLEHGVLGEGENRQKVLTWRSPPLADVIRSINKNSNNVMTRQLVYTLGAETAGAPGTREAGAYAIRQFLEEQGLDVEPLRLVNGAGLSRDERVSARLLAGLLREAQRSPYAAEYISSLSLGGLDGTTRRRFHGDGNGRLHVKTGRIDNVSALAGYVHASNGKTYAIAILTNFQDAHRGPGQELEEAVVDWVYGL